MVSVILHAGASVVFMFFSQLVEYRFYHVSVSGIYEKHRGYSVFTEFFAVFLFFISLILAIVHLIQGQRSEYTEGPVKYADSFVQSGPYRQVESYYPRPGSSASQLDPYEARFAMRELPPLPNGRRRWNFRKVVHLVERRINIDLLFAQHNLRTLKSMTFREKIVVDF